MQESYLIKIKPIISKLEFPVMAIWVIAFGLKMFTQLPWIGTLVIITASTLGQGYLLLGHATLAELKKNKESQLKVTITFISFYGRMMLLIGIMFKLMQWPGLNMFPIGLIASCISFVLVFLQFKSHSDYKRHLLSLGIHIAIATLYLLLEAL